MISIRKYQLLSIASFLTVFLTICVLNTAFAQVVPGEESENFDLQVLLTNEQAFEIAFPGSDQVKREKTWVKDEQRLAIGEICQQTIEDRRFNFYVGKKGSQVLGYALIDHMIGKSFPITFITILNVDGTVRDVEIMVYREPRGWEVKYESFLKQFFGRNAQSDYREINSITGATLSVRAITRGVSKAAAAYKVIYLDKKK